MYIIYRSNANGLINDYDIRPTNPATDRDPDGFAILTPGSFAALARSSHTCIDSLLDGRNI